MQRELSLSCRGVPAERLYKAVVHLIGILEATNMLDTI